MCSQEKERALSTIAMYFFKLRNMFVIICHSIICIFSLVGQRMDGAGMSERMW
jgi:hypothetical protein